MILSFPSPVKTALRQLEQAGHSAYAVGGCVRDSLLGRIPQDWDIAASSSPEETRQVFSRCRVLDTGEKHGTVTVWVEGVPLEITTFRTESGYSDGRRPDKVAFSRSIEDDLSRRDFTINAMAAGLDRQVLDLFGGREDLKNRVIRCVGDPSARFSEDALRILRSLRFSAELGFSLGSNTAAAALSLREKLGLISAERIWAELKKLLCGPSVLQVLLDFPEIFVQLIPELGPAVGFDQGTPYHLYDVYEHTARAVAAIRPDPELRLTMLLHDIGKPSRFFTDPKGRGHFKGHPAAGAQLCKEVLPRMKLPRASIRRILPLVRYHDADIPPKQLPLWLSKLGKGAFFDLLDVKRADEQAKNLAVSDRRPQYDQLEQAARELLADAPCLFRENLAVSSRELEQAGFQGIYLGRIQEELLYQVLTGQCSNTKEELLRLAPTLRLPKPLRLSPHPVFRFRKAEEGDLPGIEALYYAVTEAIPRELDPPCWNWHTGKYPTLETAQNALARNALFVLLADGQPAGSVVLDQNQPGEYEPLPWQTSGNIWCIHTLAIHPDCRGHGAGKRLLQEAEDWMRTAGASAARLDALAHNQPAISLYERAGYRCAGTINLGPDLAHAIWFRAYEKPLIE